MTKLINAGSALFGRGLTAGKAHDDIGQGGDEEDDIEGASEVFSKESIICNTD
jgi:hypothetical protein